MAVIAQLDVNLAANTAEFDTKLEKAERTATNFNKSLERQIATFGMTSREAKIYGMSQRGVSDETLAAARALDKQLTAMEQAAAKNAVLKAEATQLAGAFGSAGSTAASLAGGMGPLAIAAVAVGGGMMAARKGIDFVVEGVTRQIHEIDRLNDLAAKLDISFASLAGLGVAAKLDGSDLEGVARAASKLEQNLGAGSKKTVDSLGQIGLSLKELKAVPVDEAIARIADGLRDLESPADRAAVVTALFGKAGADLIPMLEGGGAAIRESSQFAQEYGLALSELDAAKVAAVADEFDKTAMAVEGAWKAVAVEFAPELRAAASLAAHLAIEVKDLFTETEEGINKTNFALRALVPGFAGIQDMLKSIGFDKVVEGEQKVARMQERLEKMKGDKPFRIGADDDQVIEKVHKTARKADLSNSEAQRIADSVATAEEKLAKRRMELAVASGIGAISMETYARAMKKADEDFAKSQESNKPKKELKETQLEKNARAMIDSLKTPLEEFEEKTKEILGMGMMGLLDDEQIARALEEAKSKLDESAAPRSPLQISAAMRGSAEDIRIRQRLPEVKSADQRKAEQQLREAKEHTKYLREIAAKVEPVEAVELP